ncbi:unnamed protein product [Mycena citricolor]|uniref:Glycoside hydrolase family 31 N-terminal domain-containing protein n=1 Tax=Mycena citricolor TaxID=2018698 RepID=A0AAD2GZR9_9AGAR|nr:unnamed protein product [Mycena citricolor]
MPRFLIPTSFSPAPSDGLAFHLRNPTGHELSVQPISDTVVRVVHQLPTDKYPQKINGAIQWEVAAPASVEIGNTSATVKTKALSVKVDFSEGPRLEWFTKDGTPFHADSKTRAYTYDAMSGAVLHYVEKESPIPVTEDQYTCDGPFVHPDVNEYVYGLGESRGPMNKVGKKFVMEGRDSLSYDWEHTDTLYKTNPFYSVYNKKNKLWYGVFYNNISDTMFDMGAEHDVLWGFFRWYKANTGPLDYYIILGDGTLPSVLTEYARLVSPSTPDKFAASLTLPPLSQLGYLSSSLALAAEPHAQEAVIQFLRDCRTNGFPVDGLYLSSGWCQDEETGNRNYFVWNYSRYPTPAEMGRIVEKELGIQLIANTKPWLLKVHPRYEEALTKGAFIRPAPDAPAGAKAAMSYCWSAGWNAHAPASYFDYSSRAGSEWWGTAVKEELVANDVTGIWIDNNEMSGLTDDDERYSGELPMSSIKTIEQRMGWNGGETRVGSAGKMMNIMGMARTTYDAVIAARPEHRPVIVSRSGLPGIQTYAHATWSGDNSTTWKALEFGTKMTLSVGMSFGPGLFGHDIGGFAGSHHPGPELLVRWCQNGAWHTRFTVHSAKDVSTTMWMYDDVPGISDHIRAALAFRYRLTPTFYSYYVSHYQRHGWPVLKPLLWHHSVDPKTLEMDDDFLFGSHILVASVTRQGATTRKVYLPSESNDGEKGLDWCELDTGVWHQGKADFVELDAPLSRTPVLVRSGGILVLGGECKRNVYDGVNERTALVFPAPGKASAGSFTLIEDDGVSNEHLDKGIYTEILLTYSATATEVVVDYEVVHGQFKLPYEAVWIQLPIGDQRKIVVKAGKKEAKGPGGQVGISINF